TGGAGQGDGRLGRDGRDRRRPRTADRGQRDRALLLAGRLLDQRPGRPDRAPAWPAARAREPRPQSRRARYPRRAALDRRPRLPRLGSDRGTPPPLDRPAPARPPPRLPPAPPPFPASPAPDPPPAPPPPPP